MTYDANGNVLSISEPAGVSTFIWDACNRLAAIATPTSTATFRYDPLGRRVAKTVNGVKTQYLYDGANIVQEVEASAPPVFYLRSLDIDEPFARDGVEYYLADALGSVIALTDAAGAVQTGYAYEPFGDTGVTGIPTTSPFGFTGRERDETGLYYYRARMYSPAAGRFLQEDPIGALSGDLNFYTYVANNPVNLTDPTGLLIWNCTRRMRLGTRPSPVGNHNYLYDDVKRRSCGSLDRGGDTQYPGPDSGDDFCIGMPDTIGHEDTIMNCCRDRVDNTRYVLFFNDCFNVVAGCLKGYNNPGAPGRRIGPPWAASR